MRQFLAAVLFLSLVGCRQPSKPVPKPDKDGLVGLADCLTEKGIVLYGASWCGFCRKQEQLFGPAAYSRLKHVTCDDPEAPGTDPGCLDVDGSYCFPTWAFPDGRRMCGLLDLSELARRSGCPYVPAE